MSYSHTQAIKLIILHAHLDCQGLASATDSTLYWSCRDRWKLHCLLNLFILAILYKFILHVIALVLALLIRNIKMEALNDSRETVVIIYASTVLLLIGCLVLATLYQSASIITIVWSIVVFSVAMVHLALTFVPKVSGKLVS